MENIILKIENLNKKFKDQIVFDDFNLQIQANKKYVILGESGSGKTTLLQILGLIDSEFSGDFFVENLNIKNANFKTINNIRKKKIGFVFQFHHLIPELTVFENIEIPLSLNKIDQKKRKIEDILGFLRLSDKINSYPNELSGGESQRVAIARAIIHEPKIIIADEPTGNLDKKNTENIFNMLFDIVEKKKISLILATHNLKFIDKFDHIFRL